MGEGGLVLLNKEEYKGRGEIIREKGTDRAKYFRGETDKYSWVGLGSSYLPSEMNAAYLLPQLEEADKINARRLQLWERYYNGLQPLADRGRIELPFIPGECQHNAHMFYIKAKDAEERAKLIQYLGEHGVKAVFHYVPLHSSKAGREFGEFVGEDRNTTRESERLLRLPMFYALKDEEVDMVVELVWQFYN